MAPTSDPRRDLTSDWGALIVAEGALTPALKAYALRPTHFKLPSEEAFLYHGRKEWEPLRDVILDYRDRVETAIVSPDPWFSEDELQAIRQVELDETIKARAYWRAPLKGVGHLSKPQVRVVGSESLYQAAYEMALAILEEMDPLVDYDDDNLFPEWEEWRIPAVSAGGWPTMAPGSARRETHRVWRFGLALSKSQLQCIDDVRKDAGSVASGGFGGWPFNTRLFRIQEAKPTRSGESRIVSPTVGVTTEQLRLLTVPMVAGSDERIPLSVALDPGTLGSLERLGSWATVNSEAAGTPSSPILGAEQRTEPADEAGRERDVYMVSRVDNCFHLGPGRSVQGMFKSRYGLRALKDTWAGSDPAWSLIQRERTTQYGLTPLNIEDALGCVLSLLGEPSLGPDGQPDGEGPLQLSDEDVSAWDVNVMLELTEAVVRATITFFKSKPGLRCIRMADFADEDELVRSVVHRAVICPLTTSPMRGVIVFPHLGTIPSGSFGTVGWGTLANLVRFGLKYQRVRQVLGAKRANGTLRWAPTTANIARVIVRRGRGVMLATDDMVRMLTAEEEAIYQELQFLGFVTSSAKYPVFLRHVLLFRKDRSPAPPGSPWFRRRALAVPVLGRYLIGTVNDESGRGPAGPIPFKLGLLARQTVLSQKHPWSSEYGRAIMSMPPAVDYWTSALKEGFESLARREAERVRKGGAPDPEIADRLERSVPEGLALEFATDEDLTAAYGSRQRVSVREAISLGLGEMRSLDALASSRIAGEVR